MNIVLNTALKTLATGVVAVALSLGAWAGGDSSDGHTHAAAPSVEMASVSTAAPRLTAETEQFELVGILEGKVLRLYLDRFDTNAPVPQAQIEVESGPWKAVATEAGPAEYTVAAELLAQPGKHPLTFLVQVGDEADLLNATLEVIPPPTGSSANAVNSRLSARWQWVVGSVATLMLVVLGGMFMRRRQPNRIRGSF